MDKPEGQHTFGVWEVGVDTCDLCDEVAVESLAEIESLAVALLCEDHTVELEKLAGGPVFRPGGATCQATTDDIPCGATTTHVHLIGYYERDEPKVGFWPLCRKHHEERTRG
jgi:hypothetical protein